MVEPSLPLTGVRVLDLSRVLAGPFCAMLLGDLGADVVKVERPGSGDDTRGWGPPYVAEGDSAYFVSVNRNKTGVAIDVVHPEGRVLLDTMLRNCDVVIENFRPGTMERWGFDDAWFAQHAPEVVRCRISGYGRRGPSAQLPGYDFILQAESGLMAITGEPDRLPTKHGVAIVDLYTGLFAAVGTLAGLVKRERGGGPARIDVNLHDSAIAVLANVAGNHLATGREAGRFGNGHPNIVPYRSFEAADGWLALAVGNDEQFRRFAALAGHPEWADDPRMATNSARVEHRDLIDTAVAAELREKTREEWLDLLRSAGVPAGSIRSVSEALSSPDTQAQQLVAEVDHAAAGMVRVLRGPIEVDGQLAAVRRPPPRLGQDTDQVLAGLGLSKGDVARLREAGVVV